MFLALTRKLLRHIAFRYGKLAWLYIKLCHPGSAEYALFLKRWGGLHSIGEACSINVGAVITDPAYVRLGDNVTLTDCTLLGHDGAIRVLNIAYGTKLESVGKIDIRENTFVGHQAIIMPNVTIGPNAIVAAGAVVTKDVPAGAIVGGIPAKVIGQTGDLVERLEARSRAYPWYELIRKREGAWDPDLEPELIAMRVKYFYPD